MAKEKTEASKESQATRFEQAARELGCDDDEAKFNAALGKVARHKPDPADARRKPAKEKK